MAAASIIDLSMYNYIQLYRILLENLIDIRRWRAVYKYSDSDALAEAIKFTQEIVDRMADNKPVEELEKKLLKVIAQSRR